MDSFEKYQSPFSWRYGSDEMRQIWSEVNKRRLWRSLWVALAQAESEFGIVQSEQVDDLRKHADDIDIQRAMEIEAEIHHDLMAEVKTFAEQCGSGKGIIHLGATSMDIEDNADALRLRNSVNLILQRLAQLLDIFDQKITEFAGLPIIAFTHLQPAEPSTLGYRLAFYAQDMLADWEALQRIRSEIRGKGFKGAVGTSAAYAELIGLDQVSAFENRLSELLGLPFYPVANQTYPRKQDYFILSALAGLGASIYKFAFDLRLLQAPTIGEWAEPFGSKQVGSSAMPFKRNPINAEKINSLARLLAQMPSTAWQNAAHSLLERTLDDSANRRTLLPEAFLICDELLLTSIRLLKGLQIHHAAIQRNLNVYAPFAATEKLMMILVKKGANRQEIHEVLRSHAMTAWQAAQQGLSNPLVDLLGQDPVITAYLSQTEVHDLMSGDPSTGIAAIQAREFSAQIQKALHAKKL